MISNYRQMRMLLIYDLPMVDENDVKKYNKFRKNIMKMGFYMLQYSVYSKVLQNESSFNQIKTKVSKIIPDCGHIIIFKLTEKQYQDMIYLRGIKNNYEVVVGGNELVVFGNNEF